MEDQAAAISKNAFYNFLLQLTPAARVGLIVFLLALALLAAGLGVRSVTRTLAPFDNSEPPLMVYEAPTTPPTLANRDRA